MTAKKKTATAKRKKSGGATPVRRASVAKSAGKAAKKKVAKKPTAKKPAKKSVKKAVRKTGSAAKTPVVRKKVAAAPAKSKKAAYTADDIKRFKEILLDLRDDVTKQINSLKNDSLKREDWVNSEEDGTDAFDRQFALTLVSSEHEALFEIDEGLRRIEEGKYGTCDDCGCLIEKNRMLAIPFAKLCIACKSKSEKSRPRLRGVAMV